MRTPAKEVRAPNYCLRSAGVKTQRAWKAKKRREIRALKAAFDTYRLGCAFTPDGEGEVGRISADIDSLTKKLGVRNWGR